MSETIGFAGRARATPVPDIVIAKYPPGPMAFSFAATLAVFAAGWAATFEPPVNKGMVVIMALCTIFTLWACVTVLRQMIFHDRRAIWIENGELIYTAAGSLPFSSVRVADIQDLSIVPGRLLRPTRIAIESKNGRDLMATLFLSLPAEAIQARLKDALQARNG